MADEVEADFGAADAADASDARPSRFFEDLSWLPPDAAFARYPSGSDLGTLMTDETYDVVLYGEVGSAAVDAFDTVRLRLGTGSAGDDGWGFDPVAAGLHDTERLDPSRPLLVLSRRGADRPLAAVQSWALVEGLIAQDGPRRLSGQQPRPDLSALLQPVTSSETGTTGRGFLRTVRPLLFLVAAVAIALIVILTQDADGPVGYTFENRTTGVERLAPDPRISVETGGTLVAVTPVPTSGAVLRRIEGARWSLKEPLIIGWDPGSDDELAYSVGFDLRSRGANVFAQDQFVQVDVTVSDSIVVFRVWQPTLRWFVFLDRALVHEQTIDRRRGAGQVRPPTAGPASECERIEYERFVDLLPVLDLEERFQEVFDRLHADGSIDEREGRELASAMRDHIAELSEALGSTGFLASRPESSEFPSRIVTLIAAYTDLADAWGDWSRGNDELNRAFSAYADATFGLNDLAAQALLRRDAETICRELGAPSGA